MTEGFVIAPFDKSLHNRSSFDCGVPPLTSYLKQQATQDSKRDIARTYTYVLTRAGSPVILGYYTLSSSGIQFNDLPEAQKKKLPSYPVVSAALLGRLTVDQQCKGQKLGQFLLMDAMNRTVRLSQELVIYALVIDALDEGAAQFYRKYEFFALPGLENRLIILTATLRQHLS